MEQNADRTEKRNYRRVLQIFLFSGILAEVFLWIFSIWQKVPADICIRAYQKQEINLHIPATAEVTRKSNAVTAASQSVLAEDQEKLSVNLHENVTFYGEQEDSYQLQVRLFGVIPFKTANVSVIQDMRLKPVGKPIGIYVKTKGILILETGEFKGENGEMEAPAVSILQEGDYVYTCDGETLEDKAQLMDKISSCEGRPLILQIERDGQLFDVRVDPAKNEAGEYKLGIWIRDNAQGVGTMTFIDETNHFGALGHGINDVDTAELMKLKNGSLYRTQIVAIKKGISGTPGELTGLITYSEANRIGEIDENGKNGIFGTVSREYAGEDTEGYVEVALKQEVETGPAQILCCIGDTPQLYDAQITALHLNNDNINRGIELKIKDERLLSQTGGIVQGMSGSPVLQNGKIVGAVNHVLVSSPEKGYAIFIENMLFLR